MLSNQAVLAVPVQYIIRGRDLKRENTWALIMPIYMAYGITCAFLIPMLVGMEIIIRIPMAERLSEICIKFRPNHIMYGPSMWEKLADEKKDLDLSFLIAPISGGDTLPSKVEEKVNNYLLSQGCRYPLMNGYGMTEVGAAVCVNYIDAHELGSVGIPFVKNCISAFDVDTGEECRYGDEGEICINAPSLMDGYVNKPEETENVIRIHKDGKRWLHTGDLGYVTKDGFVHITGRMKRYVLTFQTGYIKKVFCVDIERMIAKSPLVEKCVIVPVDYADRANGQFPAAYVVLADKAAKNAEERLRQYCDETIANPMERPQEYFFVDEFPLTRVGKVDYRKLEKLANETS